jgi:hypothetical protein
MGNRKPSSPGAMGAARTSPKLLVDLRFLHFIPSLLNLLVSPLSPSPSSRSSSSLRCHCCLCRSFFWPFAVLSLSHPSLGQSLIHLVSTSFFQVELRPVLLWNYLFDIWSKLHLLCRLRCFHCVWVWYLLRAPIEVNPATGVSSHNPRDIDFRL